MKMSIRSTRKSRIADCQLPIADYLHRRNNWQLAIGNADMLCASITNVGSLISNRVPRDCGRSLLTRTGSIATRACHRSRSIPPTNNFATRAAKYDSRFYGLPVEWEEQPFEWVKPSRFGVERVYSKGPLARLKMRAQLQPKSDGGTHLIYELWSTPRNLPGAVAIPMQINFVVARRFRDAMRKYDDSAFMGAQSKPPSLTLPSRPLICNDSQHSSKN